MKALRGSVWLIIAAALAPLALFVIFQIGYSARGERQRVESRALSRSETIILAADARVARIAALVDALGTSYHLRVGDLKQFEQRARQMAAQSGDWLGLEVVDPATGKPLVIIGRTPTRVKSIDRPGDRSRAAFAGYGWGGSCPCLLFDRPVVSGNQANLRLIVWVDPQPFLRLLPAVDSEYPVAGIADPRGNFIARSVAPSEKFGMPGSTYLRGGVDGGRRQDIYRGITLEGMENYTAFTRSDETGWTAHVALGSEYIDAPARRYFASLGLAAFVSIMLAALLVVFALRQLRQARHFTERMQQTQKLEALGQLTGGIAHDFNNLLTPIVGALDFLAGNKGLDARGRRLAGGALSAARRAGKLTGQLLAFSRKQKLLIAPVPLDPVLDELADLFEQSVGDTHRVEMDVSRPGLIVITDRNQLELAILNLVINARDASEEGSQITIAVREDADEVTITVADQGAGMDPETQRRAVEPFFSTKAIGQGTGLGLSQVYALAEQSGGRLVIESAPGDGARVSLILRRSHAEADPAAAFHEPLTLDEEHARRLLVVDDDPLVRAALVRPLEEDGHLVDSVSDGPTALSAIRQRKFDLVLVDFAMPEMDGATLIREARALDPDSRFLLVTGFADSDLVAEAAPGTPIVMKPFEADELLRAVRSLLRPSPPAK